MKRLFLTAVTASLLSSAFLISVPAAQAEEAAYKLVLLRHGESQWNLEKRFTGWSDIDLTDKGRAGAVKAGEIMKGAGVNFDEVHTSKLNRAIETAQLAQKGIILSESGNILFGCSCILLQFLLLSTTSIPNYIASLKKR